MTVLGLVLSLSLLLSTTTTHARTVFSELAVNGVDQGHAVGIRVPSSNAPVLNISSNDIICNKKFIQPVSQAIIKVAAGEEVTAHFHHSPAGFQGPDPADPLDPTNKGPVLAYLAPVPSATESDVTGLGWFKIFEDGLDPDTHQWGSDHVFTNKGNVTFLIPPCIRSGQYLLRVEDIG
ncbi:hypothetical protein HGRIS_006420 [Hohenbuehelia grisea]|uniref:AA9 family lytic polysaccharide monooxygenase n=1 Tax=Hohenbuehelia grisea TaxID=104357 RepID=A0ABR3K183_9AGAR